MGDDVIHRCSECEMPITDKSELDKIGGGYKCPSCWNTIDTRDLRSRGR